MTTMKCISCGIEFLSFNGSDQCSRGSGQESEGTNGFDSCGCECSH